MVGLSMVEKGKAMKTYIFSIQVNADSFDEAQGMVQAEIDEHGIGGFDVAEKPEGGK